MGAKRKKQEAKVGNGKKQEENERKWCTSERCGVVARTGRDKDKEKNKTGKSIKGGQTPAGNGGPKATKRATISSRDRQK